MRARCRHCRKAPALRRALCWRCYLDPAVRAKYPPGKPGPVPKCEPPAPRALTLLEALNDWDAEL